MQVRVPPSIQILPPNGQVVTRKGGPVSFECKANGNPTPTVNTSYHQPGQWHDLLVKPSQTYNSATGERSQRYRLTNLQADSVYECLVQTKNQHGYGELSDLHQWFTSPKGRNLVQSSGGALREPFAFFSGSSSSSSSDDDCRLCKVYNCHNILLTFY
ncbi:hypothetical protein NQ315_017282 [Exocentrus adspersus]|uniref:Ig-like domain-containing protein n=1 Tax=Exocentrus adspersus TaxID=1586481 RepID=A0AAV8VKA6_9CUCU|nr:hypothetical protein NQ315_017282 [Exocentrus adspersus]